MLLNETMTSSRPTIGDATALEEHRHLSSTERAASWHQKYTRARKMCRNYNYFHADMEPDQGQVPTNGPQIMIHCADVTPDPDQWADVAAAGFSASLAAPLPFGVSDTETLPT